MTDDMPPNAPTPRSGPAPRDPLEQAFAAARGDAAAEPASLSPDLAARILADAAREMPAAPQPLRRDRTEPQRAPLLSRLAAWLTPGTGWPGAAAGAGLAACAVGGLWLGYAPPAELQGVAGTITDAIGLAPDSAATGSAADLLAPLDLTELSDV